MGKLGPLTSVLLSCASKQTNGRLLKLNAEESRLYLSFYLVKNISVND